MQSRFRKTIAFLAQQGFAIFNKWRISYYKEKLLSRNRKFWKSNIKELNKGFVLVKAEKMPIIQFCNVWFGSVVALATGCKLLLVINNRHERNLRVLQSFPRSTCVFLDELERETVDHEATRKMAAETYRQLRTPGQILDICVDGIRFGDVIYDHALAEGYATISVIDERILRILEKFYIQRALIQTILQKYDLKSSVISHSVGLEGATFFRYLLRSGVEVFERIGAYQFLIKKYHCLKDIENYSVRPEARNFDILSQVRDKEKMFAAVDSYIDGRFYKKIKHPAIDLAYSEEKATYTDRRSFCQAYDLDPSLPLVFVMMHAFNDFPHSTFNRRLMFQDYYDWFDKTVKIAQGVKTVNWIFKAHPVDRYYTTKDLDLDSYFKDKVCSNIVFLGSSVSFNTRSLKYIAHAIITCLGTAGLEFSTQGVPCILGGESMYSGFGFTIEPQNIGEYSGILARIADIQPLTEEQIKKAKLVTYFCCCTIRGSHFYICPYFDDNQLFSWNDKLELVFWRQVAGQFLDRDHMAAVERQHQQFSAFIVDKSWTQYVDDEMFASKC